MCSISVVIPAFRASKTIETTINSIVNQTYLPLEVFVVLDGPDEKFTEVFKNANFPSYIRLVQLPQNVGVASARNEGVIRSHGDYIALCDADDVWHPQKLEIQVSYAKKGYKLIGTQAIRFEEASELSFPEIKRKNCDEYQLVESRHIMVYNPFYTSSLLFDRKMFCDVQFDHTCPQEDYQFLIDLFSSRKFSAVIDKRRLLGYRIVAHSRSGNILQSAINSFFVRKNNFGLKVAIFKLPLYLSCVLRKRYFQ